MARSRSLPVVLTLVAAQFLVMLDSSVLNVALPSLTADLHLTPVGSAWVLNAYFLTFGGLLLISGRAADVFGRRRMFLLGATVLVAGSLIGGLAANETVLILARLVQGAGAALLSPAAMSVILARFSGSARATAVSGWGAASAVGGAAGVTIGGLMTAAFGWQSVLFVTGAFGTIIAIAAWLALPTESQGAKRHFDVAGAGLITGSAVSVVFGALSAPHRGLFSIEVLGAAAMAGACLVGFVVVEKHNPDPVLALRALRDARVAGGVVVNVLGGAARVACFVLVALLMQQVLEYPPGVAGLAMLPTSLTAFALSTFVLPRLLRTLGPERVAFAGLLLLAASHVLLATIDNGDPYMLRMLPALVLAAAGVAFSFTPTTLVIADGMAARNAGVSSGLASSTAQIGGALGIAVFGAVDAAHRAAMLHAGASPLAAAESGLSAAHLAAVAVAAAGALVAVLSFPSLRRGDPPYGSNLSRIRNTPLGYLVVPWQTHCSDRIEEGDPHDGSARGTRRDCQSHRTHRPHGSRRRTRRARRSRR